MLHVELKNNAIRDLKNSVKNYDEIVLSVQQKAIELFKLRSTTCGIVIKSVENYINQLANTPKEFDKSFATYKSEFEKFNTLINDFSVKSSKTDFQAGGTAVAGVVAGVGTAALMPVTAMAVATTFGVASTGTAISALSGAAATNAALAWLGGGALAVGGGGMAGGSAILALAGPIGIGIGVVGIIGAGLLASTKNKEIALKANQARKKIETAKSELEVNTLKIEELIKLTKKHKTGVIKILKDLKKTAPTNYSDFSIDSKQKLGSLINHINSLSVLLNKTID